MFLLIIMTSIAILLFAYAIYKNHMHTKFAAEITQNLHQSQANELALQEKLTSLQQQLSSAIQDPVTELLGWQLFEDRLRHCIKASERSQVPMGVLFVDIKQFKMINEALGYEAGDQVLRMLAKRLQSSVRQVDSVSRYNKDIFVILLSQLSKPEMAAIVAQRILQAMIQPVEINQQEMYLNISIGIATYPQDAQNADELLRRVDEALQMAKTNNKQMYQFYQENFNKINQREFILNTALAQSAVYEQFAIYYQPIKDENNQTIFCMDALLYWHHPELGVIKPAELYRCAAAQNKLNDISLWILRHACRHFLQWRSVGFTPVYLGVPLLLKQLGSSHFIYQISQVLQEIAFNPEHILFEMKEQSDHLSFDVLEKAFNMLEYLNVKLAIEEFGANDFSLRYLKNFHVHFLKLDASFASELETNVNVPTLIASLVYLAKNMSMQLIVPGLESTSQINTLKNLGCSLMQGEAVFPLLSAKEVMEKMAVQA